MPSDFSLVPESTYRCGRYLDSLYRSDTFKLEAYKLLGGPVCVHTKSYDDLLLVGHDELWDIFSELHEYPERSFPRVYGTLHVAKINTYSSVLHWQGSQGHLKPILITAHQGNHVSSTWIWRRGCADDKGDLISQLQVLLKIAVEHLAAGFKPQRTVVFASGIDEEASGTEAGQFFRLAVHLKSTYGPDRFAMLVDEGGLKDAVIPTLPGVSEKGYFDVLIEVFTPGGHSSIPPAHTAPRKALTDDQALDEFKRAMIALNPIVGVMLKTTQVVDLIQGGAEVNALPKKASAVINHRIEEHSSTEEVQQHIIELLTPIATEYNLSVDAFEKTLNISGVEGGRMVLSDAFGSALQPSPYTRFYLTRHIFRYSHRGGTDNLYNGVHNILWLNSLFAAVRGEFIIEEVHLFIKLILNSDGADF
ncbi:Zn-dependent exopeptidase [Desarmillaria ectypa]|nr:Zn-dependent exopeptidase [Desarmillaria ectypa]